MEPRPGVVLALLWAVVLVTAAMTVDVSTIDRAMYSVVSAGIVASCVAPPNSRSRAAVVWAANTALITLIIIQSRMPTSTMTRGGRRKSLRVSREMAGGSLGTVDDQVRVMIYLNGVPEKETETETETEKEEVDRRSDDKKDDPPPPLEKTMGEEERAKPQESNPQIEQQAVSAATTATTLELARHKSVPARSIVLALLVSINTILPLVVLRRSTSETSETFHSGDDTNIYSFGDVAVAALGVALVHALRRDTMDREFSVPILVIAWTCFVVARV